MEMRIGKRVEEKMVKIAVNQYDDCIYINLNDYTIFDRFADLIEWSSKKIEEASAKEKEISEKYESIFIRDEDGNPVEIDLDAFRAHYNLRKDVYKETCEKIDSIFGEGTCRKYFRVMYEANPGFVPDEECIYDFFEEITPVMNQLFEDRKKKIELRFNKNRKGGKGNKYRTKDQLIRDYSGK